LQGAEKHERVGIALMLQQNVNDQSAAASLEGQTQHQVRFDMTIIGLDEMRRIVFEAFEVEVAKQRRVREVHQVVEVVRSLQQQFHAVFGKVPGNVDDGPRGHGTLQCRKRARNR